MARSDTDIIDPRRIARDLADKIDREKLIANLVEWPGARVLWALKLGRVPLEQQKWRRDENTVAGVLSWVVTLAIVVTIIAANA